jgi:hypothetical protein
MTKPPRLTPSMVEMLTALSSSFTGAVPLGDGYVRRTARILERRGLVACSYEWPQCLCCEITEAGRAALSVVPGYYEMNEKTK